MAFVEMTSANTERPILINLHNVSCLTKKRGYTKVYFVGLLDDHVRISESIGQFREMVEQADQSKVFVEGGDR